MHEAFRDWITSLLRFIGRNIGDEAAYEALHGALSHFSDLAKEYRKKDICGQVQMLAAGLRGHLNLLEIEEDEEKVTIMMKPCGKRDQPPIIVPHSELDLLNHNPVE